MQPRAPFLERMRLAPSDIAHILWQGTKQVVSSMWRNKGKVIVAGAAVYVAKNYEESLSIKDGEGLSSTNALIQNRLQQAQTPLSPRAITLPFANTPIISSEHDGLSFDYDIVARGNDGVVCDFAGVDKGWIENSQAPSTFQSPTIGGYHRIFLLSNKPQPSLELDRHTSLLYVGEPGGNITIKAIKNSNDPLTPTASCSLISRNSM